MSEYSMTISGRGAGSPTTLDVINPATGEIIAHCPDCTREQLNEAMETAARALPLWQKDEATRRKLLKQCSVVLGETTEELAELETRNQGMPISFARSLAQAAVSIFADTAEQTIPYEKYQEENGTITEVFRRPRGVVAAITPWNAPLLTAVNKIAPALLVGNTLILKPSPYTPLTTLRLGEILRSILPPGVLNVVSGGDELGAQITRHPAVRMISFTGSVETGKKIAAACAPDLKRYMLELGGNDPAIVLEDVDPDQIAEKLFWAAFFNTGQICIAIKRLYIHKSIFQPLVQKLVEIASRVRVGNGLDPETQMGPLNNLPQLERVIDLVEDTKKAGGKVLVGGERLPGPGYFYPPTIVTGISEGVRLVDEEQFGPALPVMPFTHEAEVIERANATNFGLGGTVWTKDQARGEEIARQIESGILWINQHWSGSSQASYGGRKWSGFGCEGGALGLGEYCDLQTVVH